MCKRSDTKMTVDELAEYILGPKVTGEIEALEIPVSIEGLKVKVKYKNIFSASLECDRLSSSFILIGTLTINLFFVLQKLFGG